LADTLLLTSSGENFYRFLVALFAFVIVIIATYYVSKWTAGYQKMRMTNRNFEVIDSLRIGTNKYLMIVRTGTNRYMCVGVGKEEFEMLGELSEDEVIKVNMDSENMSGRESISFSGLLDSFKKEILKESDTVGQDEDS
jgi:flagellar protein FliO/FliZ